MHGDSTRRGFLKTAGLATIGGVLGSGAATSASAAKKEPAAGGKPKFKLGLASYTLRKFPLEETLAMTNRLGLELICLKSFHLPLDASEDEIAAARKQIEDAGIKLYGGGVIRMKNADEVDQGFHYAQLAGMSVIVGSPDPEVLPLVDKKVRETGIKVAIHNHGPGDKHFPTPESIVEKVKDLDPRIGICMDIGHTVRIGADPYEDAKRYADRLLDIHLKDVDAAAPEGKTVEIGRGVIDIPRFLKVLIDTGYANVASFEYEKDADDPLPGLAESVGYVRGALATLS